LTSSRNALHLTLHQLGSRYFGQSVEIAAR
jgi:hypothetical protein